MRRLIGIIALRPFLFTSLYLAFFSVTWGVREIFIHFFATRDLIFFVEYQGDPVIVGSITIMVGIILFWGTVFEKRKLSYYSTVFLLFWWLLITVIHLLSDYLSFRSFVYTHVTLLSMWLAWRVQE